ncbi:DUF1440 domain-containing protein [Spirosoma flavum]|uniref:DUF1440 domain-containing protein n=1 Tax=Spirosoma flavum TaxID=2048557 RepID=A0ABW6ARL4_9BACT
MKQSSSKPSAKKTILIIVWDGFVAGTLDAIAAIGLFLSAGGKHPVRVFQYIASGIFGKDAFLDGSAMIIWGIVFHFSIALLFAAFFFLIHPQIRQVIGNLMAIGLLYGLLIWLVMNRIVLPLSNVSAQPVDPAQSLIGMVILMVLVSLPIALIVHKHYSKT